MYVRLFQYIYIYKYTMMMNIRVAYYVALICLVTTSKVANGFIGVTWGRQSIQRLVPSMVVDLILQNGVRNARIYSAQDDILEAFCGSEINLTVGIYRTNRITSDEDADRWVQDKIARYYRKVNIRRVLIGNYAFKNKGDSERETGIKAMSMVQKALNKANHGDVKAALTFSPEELKPNPARPSEAEFKAELMPDMITALGILKENNSPFVVQIFPALFVLNGSMDPAFAFPDNNDSSLFVKDVGGAVYTNAFDFVHDSFVWALEKAGAGDLPLVIDQACWSTDGFPGGNLSTAERFFRGLLPRAAGNLGTPKRPGRPIDLFVHSLADETWITYMEPWARHWGIYRSNGEPKYKIDLTGQGRDIFPARAKGIMRMPQRWCVFNNDTSDTDKLESETLKACMIADCTSLEPGGSCSQLSFNDKISFKFNVYFQTNFQEDGSCFFEGLGEVVTVDPSVGNCVFAVEVVKGSQDTISAPSSSDRMHGHRCHVFFVLLISILWAAL